MNVSTWHACFSTVAIVLVTHTHRTERYRDQDISTYTGKPTECNHCEHNKGIGSIPRTRVRALQQEVFSLRSGVVVEVLVADLLQIRGRYGLSDTAPAKKNTMKKEQTRASPRKCCDVNSKYICYFPLKDRTHFNSLLYFAPAGGGAPVTAFWKITAFIQLFFLLLDSGLSGCIELLLLSFHLLHLSCVSKVEASAHGIHGGIVVNNGHWD